MQVWAFAEARAPHQAEALLEEFSDWLVETARAPLKQLVWEAKDYGLACWLATAAPADYALKLGVRFGFDTIIPTARPLDASWRENLREEKRDAVVAELRRQDMAGKPLVVATDHADDLPLCLESTYVIWFGAGPAWQQIRSAHPGIRGVLAEDVTDLVAELLKV